MKTVIVLTLLIATVFCLPVKRSASSSESSEEMLVAQRPPPILRKAAAMFKAEPTQTTPAESNESTDSADDSEDADEESETDENEEEIETDSSESESGESAATVVPSTVEPSLDPIINTGRGDSMGYPSDYKKSIVYVDANDFAKIPSPYKSYSSEKLGGLTFVSKKSSVYDEQSINDVEKEIKLYKALQVHDAPLEEGDTSTPEVENMEPNDRQAALGSQEIVPTGNQDATAESGSEGASAGNTPNNSASASASASQEQNEEDSDSSPSSEETTTTPGAADSENDSSQSTESQESDSDEETTQTTDATVIIAK